MEKPGAAAELSIATKLYVIFALLAAVTLTLAAISVSNARRHAALTGEFGSAFAGALNVERVNALIYAVVMESRGIYMSHDIATARVYGDGLLVFNDEIGQVMDEWRHSVRSEDAALFDAFAKRVAQFREFRRELVRRGVEIGPEAGREWGDNDANRTVRKALNVDLTRLGELYAERSRRIYADIDTGMTHTAWLVALTGVMAVLLAVLGAVIIGRKIARPLARITRLTETVAAGKTEGKIPYTERGDEVGALARSIAFFQQTMHTNEDLSRTVSEEAQARAPGRRR
jgi:methyl-accepting chemotaxis protein